MSNVDFVVFDLVNHQHESGEGKRTVHVVQMPFINQCYTWDCGLACTSMVLKMFGKPTDDVYTKDLDDLGCGESIWTIDLALILYQHKVQVSFSTITLGANANHAKMSFYRRNFTEDENRVVQMFELAKQKGIPVDKRGVSINDLVTHLSHDNPVIVLVDWTQMRCLGCDSTLARCWSCVNCCNGGFQGHFIVLCGYDLKEKLMFYKNPDSKSHDLCSIPMDQFDKARQSDGTDEDVLFIYRNI